MLFWSFLEISGSRLGLTAFQAGCIWNLELSYYLGSAASCFPGLGCSLTVGTLQAVDRPSENRGSPPCRTCRQRGVECSRKPRQHHERNQQRDEQAPQGRLFWRKGVNSRHSQVLLTRIYLLKNIPFKRCLPSVYFVRGTILGGQRRALDNTSHGFCLPPWLLGKCRR